MLSHEHPIGLHSLHTAHTAAHEWVFANPVAHGRQNLFLEEFEMNKPLTFVAAAAFSSAAFGDITLDFTEFTASGAQYFDQGEVSGTLTAIVAEFEMVAPGENFTWANDLSVLVASTDFSVIDLQVGGYSDFGAANRYQFSGGASGDAGTVVSETITVDPGLALSGNLFLGNGYGGGGNGVWTGTITLVGLDAVPAPGALALLGLAGMGRRRRS